MMEFNEQDIKNAIIFLNRVDLKGSESQAMTELLMKLNYMQQPKVPQEVPPPKEPKGKLPDTMKKEA
jgi:hypothetical protein